MTVDPVLIDRATHAFTTAFGTVPEMLAYAPGRVNLIGEHTDYNEGFVLPCAIDRGTLVAASPRDDGRIVAVAVDEGGAQDSFALASPFERRAEGHWANYVCAVAAALAAEGRTLGGLSLAVAGDVPQGAGLSSSASLAVAVASALSRRSGFALTPRQTALTARRAENDFVGISCGIMDQLASTCGQAGCALLIDCRSLAISPVPIPPDLSLLVIHSRVRRGLVESAYNARRAQCEAAAHHYGVAALRDLDPGALDARRGDLDPVVFARARHVVTENARTLDAAEALAVGDITRLSALMAASHVSMRDDFEITVPAIDKLVEIAADACGADGGARMTGGGFGGCVVVLVARERASRVAEAVAAHYRAPSGESAPIFTFRPSDGATFAGQE